MTIHGDSDISGSTADLANQSSTSASSSAGGFARYIAIMRDKARVRRRGRRRADTTATSGSGTAFVGAGTSAGGMGYSAEQLQGVGTPSQAGGTSANVGSGATAGDGGRRSRNSSMVFATPSANVQTDRIRDGAEAEPASIVWGTPAHAHTRGSLEIDRR